MPERTPAATWIRFATGVADQAVAGTAQAMHRAITDANFAWVGKLARPVKAVHDPVVDTSWELVRTVLRGVGGVAAAVADGRGTADDESPRAARARAIANGSVDARLVAAAPGLDQDLAVVASGRVVPSGRAGLRAAHPDARDTVVVFVHGLVDTEAMWTTTPLPEVVTGAGATTVLVRHASGRAVARNGADLADLLEAVVDDWPVPVTRIVVVAHSMGGLVVRAAAQVAASRDQDWPARVTDVVHLATPHLGSWLEKVANVTSWTLRHASPRTVALGTLLDRRSRGIKDLRFGTFDGDPAHDDVIDDLWGGRGAPVPWPSGVTHHLVVGRLRDALGHPLNLGVGDGLVRTGSATGAGRGHRIPDGGPVEVVEVMAGHNHLASHPDVAELLATILDDPSGDRLVGEVRP